MDLGSLIGAGASLLGGLFASDAAEDAAETQAKAAEAAIAEQRRQFDVTRGDIAPWRRTGEDALNMLALYLGLPGAGAGGSAQSEYDAALQAYNALLSRPAGSPVQGSVVPPGSAPPATNALAGQFGPATYNPRTGEINYPAGLRRVGPSGYGTWTRAQPMVPVVDTRGQQTAIQTPSQMLIGGGVGAVGGGAGATADQLAAAKARLDAAKAALDASRGAPQDPRYGSLLEPFTAPDIYLDPSYQFRLGEGVKALERGAAAKGGLFSGAQGKALTRWGQDLASSEYGNAFNRDAATKARIYNFLAGVSGTGQTSAAQTGAFGQQTAGNISDLLTQQGNVQAAGIVGGANALTGGIGDAINAYQQNQLLNILSTGYGGSGGSTPRLTTASGRNPRYAIGVA